MRFAFTLHLLKTSSFDVREQFPQTKKNDEYLVYSEKNSIFATDYEKNRNSL